MTVNIQTYVEDLFRGYEDSSALQDFKEEIVTNLLDRIQDLRKSGLNKEEAFTKAVAELGDITTIADQISRQKRNEIIGEMYIHGNTKVDMQHAIGYAVAGVIGLIGLFGLFLELTAFIQLSINHLWMSPLCIVLSGSVFVFLGLTQETARNYALSRNRALIYSLASALILSGLSMSAIKFSSMLSITDFIHVILPFIILLVIPGLCVLVPLLLTEKKRNKPWVIEEQHRYMAHYSERYSDPHRMAQRGLLSGALWILAIALFVTLGFVISFKYSWVVFLFAVVVEMLIEFWAQGKAKE